MNRVMIGQGLIQVLRGAMLLPVVLWEVCQTCTPCQAIKVCRTRAIVQVDHGEPPSIEISRCSQCGLCVLACCCQAISMRNELSSGVGAR